MEIKDPFPILLSFVPVYFYYVPKVLIKTFFLEFIIDTFLELGLRDSAAKTFNLSELEKRFVRIVSFISFLSIWAGTIAAVVLNKNTYQVSVYNRYHIYIFFVFLGLGIVLILKNLFMEKKFMVNRGWEFIEIITVFLSVGIVIILL